YYLLCRHVSRPAAALGAIAFALSGPTLSNGNFLNTSWVVACVPWALWTAGRMAERFSARRFACLAFVLGLEFLAGEPVTFGCSTLVVVAYAAFVASGDGWRTRVEAGLRAVLAVQAGLLVAAAQLLPLIEAGSESIRSLRPANN